MKYFKYLSVLALFAVSSCDLVDGCYCMDFSSRSINTFTGEEANWNTPEGLKHTTYYTPHDDCDKKFGDINNDHEGYLRRAKADCKDY